MSSLFDLQLNPGPTLKPCTGLVFNTMLTYIDSSSGTFRFCYSAI